jgi:hypothetical protein
MSAVLKIDQHEDRLTDGAQALDRLPQPDEVDGRLLRRPDPVPRTRMNPSTWSISEVRSPDIRPPANAP